MSGQATHIHLEVTLNDRSVKATQIAFPETINNLVQWLLVAVVQSRREEVHLSREATGDLRRLGQALEGIEYLEPWAPRVSIVSCRDRQPMPPCGRGDVAVLDGHALAAGLVERSLLLCPDVSARHVESVDAPMQGIHQPRQP